MMLYHGLYFIMSHFYTKYGTKTKERTELHIYFLFMFVCFSPWYYTVEYILE